MTSNSQHQEDLIIEKFFLSQEGQTFKGTLLDIGANDGKTLSNTYGFIEQGWKADLVEPSPRAFAALWMRYKDNPNVQLHQCAIGEDKVVTLYESSSLFTDDDVALVSTVKPEEMERFKPYNIKFTPRRVRSITFDYLRKLCNNKTWDYISIDAEGMDLEILKQINLTEVGCKALIIEYNGKNKQEFKDYCKSHGMFLHWFNEVNLIFIK